MALPARDRASDQVSGSDPGTDYASLASRDLQRGHAVGLASGEAVAQRLGVPALSAEEVGLADAWSPTLPARRAGAFGLGDILAPVQ